MRRQIFSIFIAILAVIDVQALGQDQAAISPKPLEQFRELAKQLAAQPPVNCAYDHYGWPTGHPEELESKLFNSAVNFVTDSLNESSNQPLNQAKEALKTLSLASDEINRHWPEGHRFRYEITDVSPVILAKMTFRSSSAVIAFFVSGDAGVSKTSAQRKTTWTAENVTGDNPEPNRMIQHVQVYPLFRGPSNMARFLVSSSITACGHGTETGVSVYQMSLLNYPEQLFHRKGSVSSGEGVIEERESPQAKWIRRPMHTFNNSFNVSGKNIALPFCRFSVVDTSYGPTLCMADTFDLSMDDIRFVGREINRPDLFAVAKAIEHAQNGEWAAVRAYTANGAVAKKILSSTHSYVYSERTTVTHISPDREIIRLEGGVEAREFEVQKINGTWRIKNFRQE